MDSPSQPPININTRGRVRPKCPRCASEMILIGRIHDSLGNPVSFVLLGESGGSQSAGVIRSCYCNDCGEVTLTLE
jgi:hypothetical protein